MRSIFGKLFIILAALTLLFSVAFFTVSLILKDNDYVEQKYKDLNVSADMGMSTPDLAKATKALLDYMRGERPNITVEARVNGADLPDVFYHEKEKVHMAEVQTLWVGLESFAKYGAIGAGALLLFGFFLVEYGKRRAVLSSGLFWACGIFGGVLVFFGVWALLDFDSFWTVFHFIIFPGTLFQYLSAGATTEAMSELNWVLSSNSLMVRMLMPIFPSLVLRCAICVVLEIAVVAIAALFIRFAWRKQGKPSPVADIVVIEHDANEPVPIKGPDLVLAHKLRNAPAAKRGEILRRARNGEPLEDPPKPEEEPALAEKPVIDADALIGASSPEPVSEEPSPRGEGEPLAVDEVLIAEPESEPAETDAADPQSPETEPASEEHA